MDSGRSASYEKAISNGKTYFRQGENDEQLILKSFEKNIHLAICELLLSVF